MSFLINPFTFAVAGGDFESIATVTVGSGGASSIQFSSIPATYQHLQVRLVGRSTRGTRSDYIAVRLNGDSGGNYAFHGLSGDGASATAYAQASGQTFMAVDRLAASTATANGFGAAVIDILDYANSSKNTTIRGFGGYNNNDSNSVPVTISSGLWIDTSAVTSITLLAELGSSDFVEFSTAALYGVKAP